MTFLIIANVVWISSDHDALWVNVYFDEVGFLCLIDQIIEIKAFEAASAMILHYLHSCHWLFGPLLIIWVAKILKDVQNLLLHLLIDRIF